MADDHSEIAMAYLRQLYRRERDADMEVTRGMLLSCVIGGLLWIGIFRLVPWVLKAFR